MELTDIKKNEIREDIENLLQYVPEGETISFDSDLLEELMFQKVVINEEQGLMFKVPVWSGSFLRKLDLSKVSFEDVSFGNDTSIYDKYLEVGQMRKIEAIMDEYYASEADYSGTNAVIDLTKLFCSKHGFLALSCCNLSGLDLSGYDLSRMEYVNFSSCNVSNTGMKIPNNVRLMGYDSDLSFLDLSNRRINGTLYFEDYNQDNLTNCLLCNTCINIDFDFSDFAKLCVKYSNLDKELAEFNGEAPSNDILPFTQALVKNWRGCFVNGQFTLPAECPEKRNVVHI